jgi:hypothetical protein
MTDWKSHLRAKFRAWVVGCGYSYYDTLSAGGFFGGKYAFALYENIRWDLWWHMHGLEGLGKGIFCFNR